MQAHYVIKRPVLTEKSTFSMNEKSQYTFEVDPRATKDYIKLAVEQLYNVKVVSVTTQNKKGKHRRLRYGLVVEPIRKKATVRLAEGQTIDMF